MGNLCCKDELSRLEKTVDFSFTGLVCRAKVVEVYDGDTIRIRFRWGKEYPQFRVRLLGIDTPEIKPKKKKDTGEMRSDDDIAGEKERAVRSRDALRERIDGKVINVVFSQNDKYGRPLVTLWDKKIRKFVKENSVNEWMLGNGAVPYFGGKKQ